MKGRQLNNRRELPPRRRELRNHATSAEAVLWTLLKGKQLAGYKFRRQHSFGSYVLDFYCPARKLAVELDGAPHFDHEQRDYDEKRTYFLKLKGLKVIRVENRPVFENPGMGLDYIMQNLQGE